MNTNKFLIGGIIGGIAYFLLGYLFYGLLLTDFYANNSGSATGVMKENMADMVWWSLIVGNLFSGLVIAYVLSKAGVSSAGSGASTGAFLGLLMAGSFNFIMFATTNITTMNAMLADIGVSLVMGAIVGGIVGAYFGMGKKAS
jgi:hypothetical protein